MRAVERTLKEVPAHWEKMEQVIKLRDQIAPETLIVGNGDITSLEEINPKIQKIMAAMAL